MSGLSSLYKDTLKIWDTITYITLDTKECTEAKANIASDPMNNQYCYDLIKAGNDIYKTHLSKYSSYHKKMLDAKKDIEKAYNLNKQSAKLQEGLHNYNEDLNNQMKKMNELNSVIRRNNELMDVLQAEMIHNGEHKSSEHKSSEHKSSDVKGRENEKSYKELCEMLQAESSDEHNKHGNSNYNHSNSQYKHSNSNYKDSNIEYKDVRDEYITKLTGICALDEQTTKLDDLTPYKTNTTRIKQMTTIQKEALSIFTKKNHDYGDSFATYGPTGVIVRIGDKIQRLQSITRKGITMVNDESIRDTLMDLHNYCAMAIMLMDEDNDNLSSTMDTSLFLNTNENIVICEPGFGMYTVGDLQRQG
jgi:hypothetical protein